MSFVYLFLFLLICSLHAKCVGRRKRDRKISLSDVEGFIVKFCSSISIASDYEKFFHKPNCKSSERVFDESVMQFTFDLKKKSDFGCFFIFED